MTRTQGLVGVVLLAGIAAAILTRHGGTAARPSGHATIQATGRGTGAIVGTVTVGVQPIDAQVDEQTGRVFILNNGNASVSVLDTRTGALLGTAPLTSPRSGPVAAAMTVDSRAGRVVVMNRDKSVSVLDARTGRLVYTVPSGGASEQVAVNTRTGRIFVSNWGDFAVSPRRPDMDVFKGGNTVTVLDTRSGRHVGTIRVNGNPSALAVDERTGRVFVYSDGDGFPGYTKLVSTLDGASGRLLRAVAVAHDPHGPTMPSQGAGHIVVDDRSGRVFVSSAYAESVSMLDATSGRLLRTVGGTHPGPMAVDAHTRRVFVLNGGGGTSNGTVSILDSATGRVLGRTPVGRLALPVTPVVDTRTGRVFVANDGGGTGSVSVLDVRSGALLRTVTVGPHPFAMAVDGRSGRVFVTSLGAMDATGYLTGPGSVSVLDARSGTLLRTVPVGVEPAVIAVDERAGRAFVVNVAGDSTDAFALVRPVLPFLSRPAPPCNNYGQVSVRCHYAPGSVTVLDAAR